MSLVSTGCDSAIDRAIPAPQTETSTSPELVKEATEFGGWVLPENAKILLVRKEIVRDTDYLMAVEMSPANLAWMLEKSGFTAAFMRWSPTPADTTIAGPDLASSPNVQLAQDVFQSPEGVGMFRNVLVDERNAETRIAHIAFRQA
ncbi:hypothetical protein [Nocardia australiensis]|uniref:hypothetical protein n=1 Tax=Nocardia australiensis TaxID=2887191 RepID=UPI001D15AD1E|nr:hypothetical protein [Nocardia australiensis]